MRMRARKRTHELVRKRRRIAGGAWAAPARGRGRANAGAGTRRAKRRKDAMAHEQEHRLRAELYGRDLPDELQAILDG